MKLKLDENISRHLKPVLEDLNYNGLIRVLQVHSGLCLLLKEGA